MNEEWADIASSGTDHALPAKPTTRLQAKSLKFCAFTAKQNRFFHHGQDTLGTAVAALEEKLAEYTGVKYYICLPEQQRTSTPRGSVVAGGNLNLKTRGPFGQCAEKIRACFLKK